MRIASSPPDMEKRLTSAKSFGILRTMDAVGSTKRLQVKASQKAQLERLALEREDLEAMSRAMVEEKGLVNFQQAATLLGITRQRVYEMSMTGVLRRFTFCGSHYVSYREVVARRKADVKGGRPKRGLVERVKVSLKATAETDRAQAKLGGYAGPVHRPKKKK